MNVMDPCLVISHHVDHPALMGNSPAVALSKEMRRIYYSDEDMARRLEAGIVTKTDGAVILSFLMISPSRDRRRGIATRFLTALCESADRHGIEIEAQALSISLKDSAGTLDDDALLRFYGKFGFEPQPGLRCNILRRPTARKGEVG